MTSTISRQQNQAAETRVTDNTKPFDEHEHAFSAVPDSERRGPVTMGLLWITMVTAFPSVLIGFEWNKAGLTLSQVLTCSLISCALLLLYYIPASFLGAKTGLNYGSLTRNVFGRWGSRFISLNLIWIFIAWYGLCALFMADGLEGLFHIKLPVMALAVAFAFLMAVNNFFGFKGVANFARFFAAPVLILWVGYTAIKAVSECPATVLTAVPHKSFDAALTMVSSFIIGFAVWGNEADYWRFGKPKVMNSAVPLFIALMIGQVIFPTTGFLIGCMSGITEYGAATSFMNNYSFGGLAVLGAIVLAASYFAANDSNLFGSVQSCENLKSWSHKGWVAVLATLGAVMAAWLSMSGASRSLESIASLNCIILPTPTVIMCCEWFLMSKVFGRSGQTFARVPELSELPGLRWASGIALIAGMIVGVLTAGVIPGTESLHVGIASIQAWITAIVVYVPLRILEYRREVESSRNMFESLVAMPCPSEVAAHD